MSALLSSAQEPGKTRKNSGELLCAAYFKVICFINEMTIEEFKIPNCLQHLGNQNSRLRVKFREF